VFESIQKASGIAGLSAVNKLKKEVFAVSAVISRLIKAVLKSGQRVPYGSVPG
jgi:hypothetical protein